MAKQRRKRRNKLQPPPLSKLDTFLYNAIIFVLVLLYFGAIILCFYLYERIAFADSNVVLYAERWTLLLLFPIFIVFAVGVLGFFAEGLANKKPIFGNKEIDYFSTTRYEGVRFIFQKSPKKLSKDEKEFKRISTAFLSVICVVSLLLGIGALIGRKCLYSNGDIKIYSIVNTVKDEYSIGDTATVTIRCGEEYIGRGNSRPMCYIDIKMSDDEEFSFLMNNNTLAITDSWIDVGERLPKMLALKEYYESQGIKVSINGLEHIDRLIEYYEMTESEKEILYELFEIE